MRHIAILGLGPSVTQYLELTKRLGGRHALCEETWCINALGQVFDCDLIFHMDDVRVQMIRAAANPKSNIARMVDWLKTTKTPVITSRTHEDFPALEEFPLQDVMNMHPTGYFNSTAAYAVAYAVWRHHRFRDVGKITIFGNDFTYANAHDAEKGRACVEFWLGVATARGIQIAMPKTTTLMDALEDQKTRFYGYDTIDLKFSAGPGKSVIVEKTPIDESLWPDAETVEANYSHARHPNALVEQEQEAQA